MDKGDYKILGSFIAGVVVGGATVKLLPSALNLFRRRETPDNQVRIPEFAGRVFNTSDDILQDADFWYWYSQLHRL